MKYPKKCLDNNLTTFFMSTWWGDSKSHLEKSISSIFLESPHQVDMKNVVKSSTFAKLQKKKSVMCWRSNCPKNTRFNSVFAELYIHISVFRLELSPLSLSGAPLGPKRISIILNQVRVHFHIYSLKWLILRHKCD